MLWAESHCNLHLELTHTGDAAWVMVKPLDPFGGVNTAKPESMS